MRKSKNKTHRIRTNLPLRRKLYIIKQAETRTLTSLITLLLNHHKTKVWAFFLILKILSKFSKKEVQEDIMNKLR